MTIHDALAHSLHTRYASVSVEYPGFVVVHCGTHQWSIGTDGGTWRADLLTDDGSLYISTVDTGLAPDVSTDTVAHAIALVIG